MKYLDEYRDEKFARTLVERLRRTATKPWVLMEVCGGQTHTLVRYGIDGLLPAGMEMIHGPGCPVCVTPLETIDKAIALAQTKGVILASFGDMLRVPGSATDLLRVKAQGGDVRMVYSPLDALRLARENPSQEVVFFGVGFETTAPPNAAAVWQGPARRNEFFLAGLACAGAAGSARAARRGGKPSAGTDCARACVRSGGAGRLPRDCARIQFANRCRRI